MFDFLSSPFHRRENRPCRGGYSNLQHTVNMQEAESVVGHRFGLVQVISTLPKKVFECGQSNPMVLGKCDCGIVKPFNLHSLKRGLSKSCGCRRATLAASQFTKHGYTKKETISEFFVWTNLIKRCSDPNVKGFKNYGGRGIKVCQRWLDSFENFLADMGLRPSSKHSIDRIDNNGGYEPQNCRWSTAKEQARNTRSNVFVTLDGERKTLAEWSCISGVPDSTISQRIRRGTDPRRAIFTKKLKQK